jgi:hypothetical protein
MEKMVATLPENMCQVSKESFKILFNVVLVFPVNYLEDDLASPESIGPFLHF